MQNESPLILPSQDAIHEAGHAVVAAALGMPDISVTVVSGRLQCVTGSTTPRTYAALAVSYGGYVADLLINELPESDCLGRCVTDTQHRNRIVESHASMYSPKIDWSNQLTKAQTAATFVVEDCTENVVDVAREIDRYIAIKADVPGVVVEGWQGIKAARAFGEVMRLQESEALKTSDPG